MAGDTRIRQLDENTARLFACDCAERFLYLAGSDDRPRKAIETSRRFANGEVTLEELDAACKMSEDAMGNSDGYSAWLPACAAALAADREDIWAILEDISWNADWVADREWQTKRLLEYLGGAMPD